MSDSPRFLQDRAQGVLVGLAAGDRNLGPTEMALMVAESLVARRGFDPADVTSRWLHWWQRGAWDTGRVFDRVMALIDDGLGATEATTAVHAELGGLTAGCNGAHRAPVLAAFPGIRDDELDFISRELTSLTHYHKIAADASVAVARICRRLILGTLLEESIITSAEGLCGPIRSCLESASQSPGGRDGFSPHTLQSAVHFVVTRETFDAALTDAMEYAGMPNYCPVLVGAIAGAHFGASAISSEMLDHCKDRNRVVSVAGELIRAC